MKDHSQFNAEYEKRPERIEDYVRPRPPLLVETPTLLARFREAGSIPSGDATVLVTEPVVPREAAARETVALLDVLRVLVDRVVPQCGPGQGMPPSEWRACVRVFLPDACDEDIDGAVRTVVRDGALYWTGTEYARPGSMHSMGKAVRPTSDERIHPADQAAIDRIGAAVYNLTSEQLQGLTASVVRNIITDLGPAIALELQRAVAAALEAERAA